MSELRQVDDGETTVSESDPAGVIHPAAGVIGTAVTQRCAHGLDDGSETFVT
jgi:hypothetical protein